MAKSVRRPRVDLDARGRVAIHGPQLPVRGVWHTTECSDAQGIKELEGVVGFWERQALGYGAHLIIDKDGNSAFCAEPTQKTWAVEHRNTGTVSVELIGFARFTPQIWWLRPKQLDKLARWMAWLNLEHNIALRDQVNLGWSGHADQSRVYGGSHWDPGPHFPRRFVLRLALHYRAQGWA